MKKKGIYKGLATLLSICIGLTVGFPLNATKVQAAENLVVQHQMKFHYQGMETYILLVMI